MAIAKVIATDTVEQAFLNKLNPAIDEIVVSIGRTGSIITLTKEGGGTIPVTLLNTPQSVITGLQVTKGGDNLTFNVSAGSYVINDEQYSYAGGSVAVAAGDSTNPRLDIIVANTLGNVAVKTGSPGPNPVAPVAGAAELLLATILVKANATAGSSNDVFINLQNPQEVGGIFINSDDLGQVVEDGAAVALADLTDVDLTGLADGQKIVYDSGDAKWVVKDDTLAELDDTDISTPQEGEILKYNFTESKWVNSDELGAIKLGGQTNLTGIVTPPAISATEDDYSPTGLDSANILRLSVTSGNRSITGLLAQPSGTFIIVLNVGALGNITLVDNSAGSSANNRFLIGSNIVLGPNESAAIWYDIISNKWRALKG